MSERENLFRPIHKGLRLMLYQLGAGLQSKDFTDEAESNRFVAQMKKDLGNSLSSCVLCLLRLHSAHEESSIFSHIRPHDPDVVDLVLKEHGQLLKQIGTVSATCDEALKTSEPLRRVEVGDRLVEEVNDLVAHYLAHLNREEELLVPVMWEWFTDDQLSAMRRTLYDHLPLPIFESWMRWSLPAMNTEELVVLFRGLSKEPRDARYPDWVRMAHATLDLQRWVDLRERVDLEFPPPGSDPSKDHAAG